MSFIPCGLHILKMFQDDRAERTNGSWEGEEEPAADISIASGKQISSYASRFSMKLLLMKIWWNVRFHGSHLSLFAWISKWLPYFNQKEKSKKIWKPFSDDFFSCESSVRWNEHLINIIRIDEHHNEDEMIVPNVFILFQILNAKERMSIDDI